MTQDNFGYTQEILRTCLKAHGELSEMDIITTLAFILSNFMVEKDLHMTEAIGIVEREFQRDIDKRKFCYRKSCSDCKMNYPTCPLEKKE